MSEETLLTAARRVVRFFRIDENHGGLISLDTIQAVEILDRMVRELKGSEYADALIPQEEAQADGEADLEVRGECEAESHSDRWTDGANSQQADESQYVGIHG